MWVNWDHGSGTHRFHQVPSDTPEKDREEGPPGKATHLLPLFFRNYSSSQCIWVYVFKFALKWNNIFCSLAILRFCHNLLHTLWALMLLLKGIAQCVKEPALAFLKGSLYWSLLMNYPKCRRAVAAGVQSKSPTSACKCFFEPWHTEPWCSSPSFPLPQVRWGGILSCQHYIWWSIPPSAKGSPGIKGNLCRASSALNLKGAIWSWQLLISLERQRR